MLFEIGSNFWLSEEALSVPEGKLSIEKFHITGSDICWLSTGRSSIGFVLDDIALNNKSINKTAILPSFTCDSVIMPFVQRGYEVLFVNVNNSFDFDADELKEKAKKAYGGVFLFHRYFGFDTFTNVNEIVEIMKDNSISVVEDCTQSLYSRIVSSNADYYVGSIRKWCGVPDGGFAVKAKGDFLTKPTGTDVILESLKIEASLKKYDYLHKGIGEKQVYLSKYREAENALDNQKHAYLISESSRIIQSNLDTEKLRNKRRDNYNIVVSSLKVKCALPSAESNTVPLYCPVYIEKRGYFQEYLRENLIFAPILWPRYEAIPKSLSYDLYEHLICLPIDQRYGNDDMARMVSCINKYGG